MRFFNAFIGFLLTFFVIDALWIGLFVIDLYQSEIGFLLAEKPKLGAALVFYLAYAAITVHLVIMPSLTCKQVAINGALLGIVGYGTYAATNYAMIAGWSSTILIIDVLWGAAITSICSLAGFIASSKHA